MYIKKEFLVLSLVLIFSCSPIKKLYVPFSQAKVVHQDEKDDVIRIYFDRMGFIYPNIHIDYQDFKRNDGRLNSYYSNNNNIYNEICKANKANSVATNLNTLDPSKDPLQESLLKKYAEKINGSFKNEELVFIIHGFNEYPLKERDSSSFKAMKETRTVIADQYKKPGFKFVEIYWDGLSVEGGAKILTSLNSIKIWNNAQASATNVGLELRRLLLKLNKEKIRVVTHSHGAGVITTALFNVEKFRLSLYSKEGHWLNNVKKKYGNNLYNTPIQKFSIGMLAPAIPGVNVFDEYFHRTELGKEVKTNSKNLRFIVGFNENDPITSKFNIAAKKLGSTTLACKKQELLKTESLFNDKNVLDHIDFSTLKNGAPQKNHSWFMYLENKPSIDNFVSEVFK